MDPQEVTAIFIASVRRLMKSQEPPWTQAELGRRLGVSPPVVSRLLSGRIFPGSETIGQLCEAFGVEPSELLTPTETPKPKRKK